MANVIGLNFLGTWLVAAEVRGGKPALRAVAALRLPSELTLDSAESLGKWLASELAAQGVTATDVVCTLGRNVLSSKLIRVPACPDHELPAIVSFAAEGELHASLGDSVLDFQPGPEVQGEREIFATLAPLATVEALRLLCQAAGLNLKHICPRAFATRYFWQSESTSTSETVLIVSAGSEALNLSLWSGERLQLSRYVPISAGDDPVARASLETRRTLAAFHSTRSQTHKLVIAVCGFQKKTAAEEIAAATGEKVEGFSIGSRWQPKVTASPELLDGADLLSSGESIAAVGAALAQSSERTWPIDFLNPKKIVVPRNQKRILAILGGALAAMIFLAGVFYVRGLFKDRDQRIKLYADQLTAMNQQLAALRPTLERHRVIKDWANAEQDWLSELAQLSATFPDTSQAYLTSLELYAGQAEKPGSLKLEGKASGQSVITAAQREWANDKSPHYKVSPRGMDPTKDSTKYPWRFGMDLATATELANSEATLTAWADVTGKLVPEGKKRIEVAFENKSASPTASDSATAVSDSKDSRKETERGPNRESRESSRGRAGGSSGESSEESADPAARLVAKLKGLSADEREKEIAKAPKFLQARIRLMIKEQSP